MTPSLGVVVRCGAAAHTTLDTLRSIERQETPPAGTVVVADRTTPGAVLPWLKALAGQRSAGFVVSAGDTPGAAWNAGIRGLAAATHVSCLAAGDRLDRRFTRLALQAMSVAPAPAFVSPGSSDGNMAMGRPATPSRIDAAALLSDFDLADPASVFCRWTFEAAGGFDERLPTLASFDLFLRLLGANGAGARLPWALVEPAKALTLPDAGQRALALSLIVDSHREMFSTCWRDVLTGRASALQRLEQARRRLAVETDELNASMESARRRISSARGGPERDESGHAAWPDGRRLAPLSDDWGFDRGLPVDRAFIVDFLGRHARDVRGAVLEVQEPVYTRQFGGAGVTLSDVIDINPANPHATIVADLRAAPNVPADSYDCLVVTQTLHAIDDMNAAIRECARILKPGGVLLATFPTASLTSVEYGPERDFWRVTEDGVRRLAAEAFPPADIAVASYGNVLTTSAGLYGLAAHELTDAELWTRDRRAPTLIALRSVKPADPARPDRRPTS